MDIKERIRRSPPRTPEAARAPGHPRGRKGRVAALPLSVAALLASGVLLLLLAGGSAARRGGQFPDADPATRLSADDRGDGDLHGLHQARPHDDFPINQFKSFSIGSPESYGNMLKTKDIGSDGSFKGPKPGFIYLHLAHDYDDYDKLFFCEYSQQHLQGIPWLILRSDNYFVPSLFLMPAYQEELMRLFPQKDTVFHHLGRYLFHPTNVVWGLITRYYDSYLARADEKLGVQIRVFDSKTGPFQHVLDQVLSCTLKENLLPEVNAQQPIVSTRNVRSKVVLITSLNSGYYERIRNMYWEHPTTNGEIISFHQPSHEEHQDSDKKMHNMKAWAEIYLLSLSDVMVTSAWSTFGYVAQGLSGMKTWLMFKPENRTAPNPPCRQVMSMEPCFHAPPFYDCKARRGADTGKLVPHVRHCEDMSWGLKLVDADEW
ncbi:Galactoside 2-alpha-L-fucosyltransferase [Dichanthelium oligosanthes]|uniref:Fucosyltransferase n=1 Tax=Dichanthelium oligosanthes TaxID=888268 RepID=A0A1E5VNZ7_9POAL|nr:Galactoside 2-alpha-L-fucosyltransferase [Dichanthelium oligosanthes]